MLVLFGMLLSNSWNSEHPFSFHLAELADTDHLTSRVQVILGCFFLSDPNWPTQINNLSSTLANTDTDHPSGAVSSGFVVVAVAVVVVVVVVVVVHVS